MRLVIFNPYHFPIVNPRSIRINNLLKTLGHNSDFIFITNPINGKNDEVDHRIKLHGFSLSNAENHVNSSWRLLYQSVKKYLIPDVFLMNAIYHLLIYQIKYRREDDVILTISHPISTHLIGLLLKLFRRGRIKWIADIGDRFTNPYSLTYAQRIISWLEKTVIRESDLLIFNSESLREQYIFTFTDTVQKSRVISNGPHIDLVDAKSDFQSCITLNYIGNTYLPIRPATEEIMILRQLQEKLLLIGISNEVKLIGTQYSDLIDKLRGINDLYILTQQDAKELESVYRKTNILISFANNNYDVVPSKLEEYCISGLPIVCFCNSMEEAAVKYLLKYGHNKFIFQMGVSEVDELLIFILAHRLDGIQTNQLFADYYRVQWQKYLDELNICKAEEKY